VITPKTIALTAGGVAIVALAGAAAASAVGDSDPESSVQAVEVGSLADSPASGSSGSSGSTSTTVRGSHQVAGLSELSGRVSQAPDDDGFDDLVVQGVELDFGPDEWTAQAGPMQDYDRDGRVEVLRAEIEGLRGTDSTFRVRFDDRGDEAEVFLINGLTYHDPAGAAPWQSSGTGPVTARDDHGGDDDPADHDVGDDRGGDRRADDHGGDDHGVDRGGDDHGSGGHGADD
jgi:hypothetical protein